MDLHNLSLMISWLLGFPLGYLPSYDPKLKIKTKKSYNLLFLGRVPLELWTTLKRLVTHTHNDGFFSSSIYLFGIITFKYLCPDS